MTVFEADQIDLSPDGRYLAAVSSPPQSRAEGRLDWQLAVVDLEQSPLEVRFLGHEARGGPRFAADSRTIIDIHGDGRVHYLDVETGRVQRTLTLDPLSSEFTFLVLSGPEDRRFVLAEDLGKGAVVAWEVSSGRQIWSERGGEHATWQAVPGFGVDSMRFTPDSDYLVAGGAGTAAIWNVELGAVGGVHLEVDPSRRDAGVRVGVTDEGRSLVTFTAGTGLREWDVSPDRLLEHACSLVARNLTEQEWDDVLPDRPYERTCPAEQPR